MQARIRQIFLSEYLYDWVFIWRKQCSRHQSSFLSKPSLCLKTKFQLCPLDCQPQPMQPSPPQLPSNVIVHEIQSKLFSRKECNSTRDTNLYKHQSTYEKRSIKHARKLFLLLAFLSSKTIFKYFYAHNPGENENFFLIAIKKVQKMIQCNSNYRDSYL